MAAPKCLFAVPGGSDLLAALAHARAGDGS